MQVRPVNVNVLGSTCTNCPSRFDRIFFNGNFISTKLLFIFIQRAVDPCELTWNLQCVCNSLTHFLCVCMCLDIHLETLLSSLQNSHTHIEPSGLSTSQCNWFTSKRILRWWVWKKKIYFFLLLLLLALSWNFCQLYFEGVKKDLCSTGNKTTTSLAYPPEDGCVFLSQQNVLFLLRLYCISLSQIATWNDFERSEGNKKNMK